MLAAELAVGRTISWTCNVCAGLSERFLDGKNPKFDFERKYNGECSGLLVFAFFFFFLTKAKPKSPECCGEEGSPLAGAPVGCQDDSSQLCHIVAWVILSSTDSIPASRPGPGRTRVTSWMCLALLAADFFFFSFCFLLLFFLSKRLQCCLVLPFPPASIRS